MTARRFRELPRLTIWRKAPDDNGSVFSLPGGIGAADDLQALLDEISSAHKEDLRSSGGHPAFDDLHSLEGRSFETSYEQTAAYVRRTLWRFGSYVVFACVANGILMRVFNDVAQRGAYWIDHYSPVVLPPSHIARFETVKLWRDKVFGHTAFADPKKGGPKQDNASDQATSLEMITGGAFSILSDGDIAFGGMQAVLGGTPPNHTLRPFSVPALEMLVAEHLDAWWSLLEQALLPFTAATLAMLQRRDRFIVGCKVFPEGR